MALYAIGRPGEPVRIIVDVTDDDIARSLKHEGEQVHTLNRMPTEPVMILGDDVVAVPLTLERARESRWLEAKDYRRLSREAGCPTPVGLVQTNPSSLESINIAATDALRWTLDSSEKKTPWVRQWTMADDDVRLVTASDMIALATSVANYLDAIHQASQAIRTAIYQAETVDEVLALDITANYPR